MNEEQPTLTLADGWQEIAPQSTKYSLVYTRGPEAYYSRSDFTHEERLGYVGYADCPFAVFSSGQVVFRYASQGKAGSTDFSALAGFTPEQKKKAHTMLALPPNQWIIWLCEFVPGSPILCALLATDMPSDDQVHIKHQLLFYNIETSESRRVNLCRDAFNPLAADFTNREIMFAGGEGIHRVAFNGQRIETITTEAIPVGRGAAYSPDGKELIIGGAGLFRWKRGSSDLEQITKLGQYPVWALDGKSFYYSESSGNLCQYDCSNQQSTEIVSLKDNERSEITFSRPIRMSQDGRYLATSLTRKYLPKVAIENDPLARFGMSSNFGRNATDFKFEHLFVVLDLEQKKVWKCQGYKEHVAFMVS